MPRKSRRKMERVSLEALLDATPVANQAARIEKHGEGMVVYLPIRRRWWMKPPFSWAMPYRDERGVALDKLGTEVYRAVNGRRTVEQIIDAFAEAHRLRFHEARLAVMQFLRMLAERNIVALAIPDTDELMNTEDDDR